MARPLRIQFHGAVYHVTCRGNERKQIYSDEGDRPWKAQKSRSSEEQEYKRINLQIIKFFDSKASLVDQFTEQSGSKFIMFWYGQSPLVSCFLSS